LTIALQWSSARKAAEFRDGNCSLASAIAPGRFEHPVSKGTSTEASIRKKGKEYKSMCDYSLINVPNRLANEGEELVTHRFPTGSLGFASSNDLCASGLKRARPSGIWSTLKRLFDPLPAEAVAAVCIPPGACLMLLDIPVRLQRDLEVGATEEVVF